MGSTTGRRLEPGRRPTVKSLNQALKLSQSAELCGENELSDEVVVNGWSRFQWATAFEYSRKWSWHFDTT